MQWRYCVSEPIAKRLSGKGIYFSNASVLSFKWADLKRGWAFCWPHLSLQENGRLPKLANRHTHTHTRRARVSVCVCVCVCLCLCLCVVHVIGTDVEQSAQMHRRRRPVRLRGRQTAWDDPADPPRTPRSPSEPATHGRFFTFAHHPFLAPFVLFHPIRIRFY